MIGRGTGRTSPVELSADPAFAERIKRLGAVSVVAPGVIWWLAVTRLAVTQLLLAMLLVGWWLMPAVLFASLPFPALRPLLILPSTLITLPVLLAAIWWTPHGAIAAIGWGLIAAGLLMGGLLGGWFWFRWATVPSVLDDPFSAWRWRLIAIHVSLICLGIVLAAFG